MEPAASIIKSLGGAGEVARLTGVFRTTPAKWRSPVEKGGTGGQVPLKHIPALLRAARDKGVKLTADDFLPREGAAQ